jgi:branched-chain amino acid aminotransferase
MTLIPFDDRDGVIWFDGALVPWREAKVHVLTHGLHYASCVFEGERAYDGKIFKLREHSERLHASARALGFEVPYSVDELDKACREVVAAQEIGQGYVRPVAWRGSEQMAVSAQRATIHTAVAAWPWPPYFSAEARLDGVRLGIAKWRRPAPDTAPTQCKAAGLYMICTLSKHAAEAAGFDDALMLDYRGLIAEATGANIFLVKGGELHTPTPDCFLDGITRRTVIELARARGIEVVERAIRLDDLEDAEGVFLTGTAVEVTPVKEIDGYTFTVGSLIRQLVEDYDLLMHSFEDEAASAA